MSDDIAKLTPEIITKWLQECASYFRNRDTEGEDKAHWANVYDAEMCERIISYLSTVTPPGSGEDAAKLADKIYWIALDSASVEGDHMSVGGPEKKRAQQEILSEIESLIASTTAAERERCAKIVRDAETVSEINL